MAAPKRYTENAGVVLTPEQKTALRDLGTKKNRSESLLIRRAIVELLRREGYPDMED